MQISTLRTKNQEHIFLTLVFIYIGYYIFVHLNVHAVPEKGG